MATDAGFAEFVTGQIEECGEISCKKMFGEYAIYVNGKITALICDNTVYVKITGGGRAFIGQCEEGSPYPGAKPCFVVDDRFEDGEWFSELIRITESELPSPKPKKPKARKIPS